MTPVMQPSAYTSAGSVDGTTSTIHQIGGMPAFKRRFPFMGAYTIEMVLHGQSGAFALRSNNTQPFLLWGAELKPSFFDAELLTPDNLTYYNKKKAVPGMEHSGDIVSENHFMHSVVCTRFVENTYCAAAVAYNNSMAALRLNKLTDFEAVSPFILLVDHEREVMLAVPFSLEAATIGDSMMIGPLIFHLDYDGALRWYVPATSPTDGRVATGEFTPRFKERMRHLADNFERDYAAHSEAASIHRTTPNLAVEAISATTADVSSAAVRQVVFVQDGIALAAAESGPLDGRCYASFGTTLVVSERYIPKAKAPIVLPILSGEAHGHAALALGSRATSCLPATTSESWRALVDPCPTVVVHANDGDEWYEGVLQAQVHRLVGLMVVHVSKELSCDAKARAVELSDMKLCCARMMSGLSIILVRTPGGATYFYRGAVCILPVCPETPKFGDPVDLDATLALHFARAAPLSGVGSFVPQSYKMVHTENGGVLSATSADQFTELAMQGGVAWESAATQLAVCLSTAEVDSFKSALTKLLLDMESDETKDAREHTGTLVEALKEAFADAPAGIDLTLHTNAARQAVLDHKQTIRQAQAVYREALGRVEQVCSLKIVSARKIGVQQAQRKMAVQQNVARATALTSVKLADKLMDTTWGFAVARVDATAAFRLLSAISASGMDRYLQELVAPRQSGLPPIDMRRALCDKTAGFGVAPNCQMLDSESVQIMLEHTQTDHILTSTGKKQLTFSLQGVPHLVLPLYDDYAALNGDYVDFMDRANHPHVSDYRVTLRDMLSNLKARCPVNPASPDLTFGIQMIVLSLMHSMTTAIADPKALDAECTLCHTLRGLFYLWGTFAGSGQKPVTFAYQLTQPGAKLADPKLRGEWTIYALVAHIFPYLRLPLDAFRSNVRTLLVRAIYRALILPILDASKAASAAADAATRRQREQNRNIALRWNYAACAVLTRIDKKSLSDLDGIASASKLLQVTPTQPTYTSTQLITTLTLIVHGKSVHWDLVRTFIACATVKRSGCFAQHKKKQTISALTRAKVMMCEQINMKLPGDIVLTKTKEEAPSNLLFCGQMDRDGSSVFVFKDPAKPSDILVQNEAAYADADIAKIKGDAELTREAWRIVGEPIADGLSNSDFLRQMLPTIVDVVPIPVAETLMLVKKSVPKHCAGNDALANLWESADALTSSTLAKIMPEPCLRTLFAAIRVSADEQSKAVGSVLHILMGNPKHAEANEHAAVQHLKAAYDAPPATVEIE